MKIYKSIEELIGKTPIVELAKTEKEYGLKSKLYAKLEMFNPAGSAKDRIAVSIIDEAEKQGKLKAGGTIIESTSGNTGIGLAMVGVCRGYKVIIVMPDTMSRERIQIMEAYGAKVVLSDGNLGMKGANELAQKIATETPNSFVASQFENGANPKAHYETTGPEIYENMEGRVDIFVCAVGTGGTLSGVGKYLKEKNPQIKIVAVEPQSSPLLSKGVSGPHKIQGIGANFVPSTLDTTVYDEIITVSDEDAYKYTAQISKTEGILAGISSGAALCAAIALAKKEEGKNIVVLLPDTGMRYLSNNIW
ncbi:MAG: cysteine synthase A [Ruminococcaceae bacterium]|nr:cysteine synthase A [Oscillospiraceae bacterium]